MVGLHHELSPSALWPIIKKILSLWRKLSESELRAGDLHSLHSPLTMVIWQIMWAPSTAVSLLPLAPLAVSLAATCYIHLGYSTQLQGTSISRIFNYHPRRSFSRVVKVPWDDGNNLKGQGLIDIFEGEMHCFSPATLAYYFRLHTLLDCNICIQIIM